MKHRVWFDPKWMKHHTEAEDGLDFDTPTAATAAEAFARDRYSAYQHVNPGVVLVRAPNGAVTRFNIGTRVVFTVDRDDDQDVEGSLPGPSADGDVK